MPNTGQYIILKDHKIAILYLIDIDYQLYSVYSYQPAFDNVKRWAVCFIRKFIKLLTYVLQLSLGRVECREVYFIKGSYNNLLMGTIISFIHIGYQVTSQQGRMTGQYILLEGHRMTPII